MSVPAADALAAAFFTLGVAAGYAISLIVTGCFFLSGRGPRR